MDRFISEPEIIKLVESYIHEIITESGVDKNKHTNEVLRRIVNDIKAIPTAEPKTGHWISLDTGKPSCIKDGMTTESVMCSECDEWLTASDEYACDGNYCPNCGAKMGGEEDG